VGSCFSCHGEPLNNRNNVLRGASGGAIISRTIAAVGAMGYLRQYLNEADLADVSAYLATAVPSGALEELPDPWPTVDDFGAQVVGTLAAERTVLIRNLQPRLDIAIGSVVSSDPEVFPLQPECPLGLPPLGQCRVRTWFRPRAPGAAEARLDILTPGGQVLRSARLLGTGVDLAPVRLAWEPARELIDFGRVELGRSATHTLTLHNLSSQPVLLRRLRVTGPQALRFSLAAACASAGSLQADERCEVTITHTPRAAERAQGWVELDADASAAPLLRVQAIGVAAVESPPTDSTTAPQATGGGAITSVGWWLALAWAALALRRADRLHNGKTGAVLGLLDLGQNFASLRA
jgi:hypothetical protein